MIKDSLLELINNKFYYEHHLFTGISINEHFCTKFYYKNGLLHREDGPAIIYPNGTQEYYKNGKLHREDGPAIIYPNESKLYFKNGLLHREDGPAVIFPDGKKEYYLNGKNINYYVIIIKNKKIKSF